MEIVKIGSRESRLAVIQTNMVIDFINESCKEKQAQIVTMKTTGDKILNRTLDKIGGKGLFVKELDCALREGRTILSVHSLKDMPMEVPEDLPIIGYSKREDPRDALILPKGATDIDFSKPVGCSSQRRIVQLKKMYPGVKIEPIRGNVQTRLAKLDSGLYGATILAAAGLKRLGLENRISRYFEVDEMIPAAGQGILCVQGKAGMDYSYLNDFFDEDSTLAAQCERAFVTALNGGCSSPIAAYAEVTEDGILLSGLYYDEENGTQIIRKLEGSRQQAEEIGRALAEQMKG